MLSFFSAGYEYLVVYPDLAPDLTAILTLSGVEGNVTKRGRSRESMVFQLGKNMEYTLSIEEGTISLAYLYSENDMERGVSFLTGREEAQDETFRHFQTHLPIFAVSLAAFFEGNYHLFYLSSPFGKTDENRYLCHAVSRDMLSWKQLPILLEPPSALCLVRHRTGGIYGGCLEVEGGKARLYFSRRIQDAISEKTLFSYQSFMESRDLLHFSAEETVIKDMPPKADALSDPFIFTENGEKFMFLGGSLREKGAVFLYKETERGFTYIAPLYRNKNTERMENASFFRLGRTAVLMCTLAGFPDTDGNGAPVYLFAGSFAAEKFKIKRRTRLDFGGDFYAARPFSDGKRTLLFGTSSPNGGTLLQRELSAKKGKFYVKPIRELYSLLGEILYKGGGEAALLTFQKSAFYVKLSFLDKTPFRLFFGENEKERLSFLGNEDTCGFSLEGASGTKFYDAGINPAEIEIFADGETVAVFLDGGRAAGTKRFTSTETVFKAEFQDETKVEFMEVWEVLKP